MANGSKKAFGDFFLAVELHVAALDFLFNHHFSCGGKISFPSIFLNA